MSGPGDLDQPDGRRHGFAIRPFRTLGPDRRRRIGRRLQARDPQLGRLVALKVARAETLFSQEAKLRFIREARVLAALRHPNIIPVYEAGEANGLPYIVEELCDGPNLAAWLRQQSRPNRPCRFAVAAQWAMLTAKAVAHAHAAGIVHRDLKPANVLLEATAPVPIACRSTTNSLGRDSACRGSPISASPSCLAPRKTSRRRTPSWERPPTWLPSRPKGRLAKSALRPTSIRWA